MGGRIIGISTQNKNLTKKTTALFPEPNKFRPQTGKMTETITISNQTSNRLEGTGGYLYIKKWNEKKERMKREKEQDEERK
jgi:hypothetical protein